MEARQRAASMTRSRNDGSVRAVIATALTDAWDAPDPDRAPARVADLAFRALADSVRDYAIVLLDHRGVITFWGEGARLMEWWTREEAEGAHLRLLYPDGGSDDGTAEAHLQYAAEYGEYTGEGRRVRSDESKFWAGVTLTALRDAQGALLGFAKITRDLTARRAADALIQAAAEAADAARESAESANRAKSAFLATMSHEIRTPVNAILGYYDLLELGIGGTLSEVQRGYLKRAGASGRHLLTLIDEILDFSRIEAGRVAVGTAVFRVGNPISDALALVEPAAAQRGVELVDSVSGAAAGLSSRADESRVRQIVVNLLSNAVKFSPPGARVMISAGTATQPSPEARLGGQGPWVYIRVEDNGIGIPADRLDAVFEPFVQGDMTLTRQHGGTGLGLAISRRLARLMGGDLTARSEVGVGSTFCLWLTAVPEESLRTPSQRSHADAAASGEARGEDVVSALRALGDALRAQVERILHGYVARIRRDPETPSAHALDEKQLEDHLATFLADVTQTIGSMDVAAGVPNQSLRDGAAIQRIVASRHGAQRARLGWAESELRREFMIIGEELAAAVRRRLSHAPAPDAAESEATRALDVIGTFLELAEEISIESYRATVAGGGTAP